MKFKSIIDYTSQPPLFEFEGFIVRPLDPWNLWIENPHGEGTSLPKAHFLGWLIRLFKEAF